MCTCLPRGSQCVLKARLIQWTNRDLVDLTMVLAPAP